MKMDTLSLKGGDCRIASRNYRWSCYPHRESRTREEHSQVSIRGGSLNNLAPICDLGLINHGLGNIEGQNISFTKIYYFLLFITK